MKRVPLRRRTPLRARSFLRRFTALRPWNRARRKRLYASQFGAHADRIRAMPCAICGKPGPSDPAHVRSRGAGGTWRDLVPLCRADHAELHEIGRHSFERLYNVNLAALARSLAERPQEAP